MPRQKVAPGDKLLHQTPHQKISGRLLKIDHHVSAENNIEGSSFRTRVQEIESPKAHAGTNLPGHPPLP